MNQLYINIYSLFFRFFSHVGHYRVLSRVLGVLQLKCVLISSVSRDVESKSFGFCHILSDWTSCFLSKPQLNGLLFCKWQHMVCPGDNPESFLQAEAAAGLCSLPKDSYRNRQEKLYGMIELKTLKVGGFKRLPIFLGSHSPFSHSYYHPSLCFCHHISLSTSYKDPMIILGPLHDPW